MEFSKSDIALAGRIKALGHPARLAIVRALIAAGEDRRCCGDIVQTLPLAQSTVSQHLKVLLNAGLIDGKIDGPRSCYCINRGALNEIADAVGGIGLEPMASCQEKRACGR